jgi:hypothetical protein
MLNECVSCNIFFSEDCSTLCVLAHLSFPHHRAGWRDMKTASTSWGVMTTDLSDFNDHLEVFVSLDCSHVVSHSI